MSAASRRAALAVAVGILTGCAGCAEPGAEQWELDHDRVIAVRATPPRVPADAASTIDVLVTSMAEPAEVEPLMLLVAPDTVEPLAGAVEGGQVVAPDDEALAEARVALGLAAGAPVPLVVAVTAQVGDQVLVSTKTVWLGDAASNPVIDEIRVGGEATTGNAITAPAGELELAIEAAADDQVDWLTSVGELSDFDDPVAHLDVEGPAEATIVVVRRDGRGGVAWRTLAVSVQ